MGIIVDILDVYIYGDGTGVTFAPNPGVTFAPNPKGVTFAPKPQYFQYVAQPFRVKPGDKGTFRGTGGPFGGTWGHT